MVPGMFAVHIDGSEVKRLSDRLKALPEELRKRALTRSYSKVKRVLTSRVLNEAADRNGVPRKVLSPVTRTHYVTSGSGSSVDQTLVVRGKATKLAAHGMVRQSPKGVDARGWGGHAGTFLAVTETGHLGVFYRRKSKLMRARHAKEKYGTLFKAAIREAWGANAASTIIRAPDHFGDLLVETIQLHFVPELDRQIDLALRGL